VAAFFLNKVLALKHGHKPSVTTMFQDGTSLWRGVLEGCRLDVHNLRTCTGRNACDYRGFATWQTASKPTSIEDVFLMFAQLAKPLVNCGKLLPNKIGKPLFF
jgi:hypothetical protein